MAKAFVRDDTDVEVINLLEKLIFAKDGPRGRWHKEAEMFVDYLHTGRPFHPILTYGSKDASFGFSTLPLLTCPGAGECVAWCYSLKSWRYPESFFRQMQNFDLLRRAHHDREVSELFEDEIQNLPEEEHIRLYRDGDFQDANDVLFWIALAEQFQDRMFWGWTKAFDAVRQAFEIGSEIPRGFRLRLSGNGRVHPPGDLLLHKNIVGTFYAWSFDKAPLPMTEEEWNMKCPGKCKPCGFRCAFGDTKHIWTFIH